MNSQQPFKWRHFQAEIILLNVRWYLRYPLSYRNLFLGVSFTESASAEALTQGYGEFHSEARFLNPNYAPITVNTDAWDGTQQAWHNLFPTVTLVLCFRDCCTQSSERMEI